MLSLYYLRISMESSGRQSITTKDATQHKSEQAKEFKWRKLQTKYLQYIELLKKKVERAQHKLISTDQTRISNMENMPPRTGPPLCFEIITKMERIRTRHLVWAFFGLVANLRIEEELAASKDLELTQENRLVKINTVKALLLIRQLRMANVLDMKHSFVKILNFSQTNRQFPVRVFDLIEWRFRFLKRSALKRLNLCIKMKQPPINVVKKCLLSLESTFESIPKLCQVSTDPFFAHAISENSYLHLTSNLLNQSLKKLQLEIAKLNEQRTYEISKKQKGLQELAQQMTEKDEIIADLQREIELLRENTNPVKQKQIDYEMQLGRQNAVIMKLQNQLKEQAENYQHIINKSKNAETALQNQVKQLQEDLVAAESKLVEFGYDREDLDQQRTQLESTKQRYREEHAKLVEKDLKCARIEQMLIRIETVLLSKAHLLEEQQESAKNKLQRIQTMIQNLHNTSNQSPVKKGPQDIIDIVEEILENPEPIKYTKLYHFGNLAEDINRIQEKIFRLKKNIFLTKEQQLNGVKQRRRKWQAQASDSQSQHPQSCQALTTRANRSNPQLTGRLIELQMQKTRCQQLVLQLKQKTLMVRKVVHQFVRSLNIKSITKETDYTLGVLLDVFQYSQEEKEQMLSGLKKKGFFSLFDRS